MARDDLDAEMLRLASLQHGVVGREQVRRLAVDDRLWRRRADRPSWDELSARVLRVAGAPETAEQRWLAAVLDAGPGAVLSHHSACALHGIPGFDTSPTHVTRPRRRSRRPSGLAVVHEPLRLPAHHQTVVRQVPVTTAARALFDVAGAGHPGRAERALDNALARRITAIGQIRAVSDELAGKGVPGSATMRRLLAARDAAYVAPDSGLEARCFAWLDAAGFPPVDRQVALGDANGFIGRVDGLCRDLPVIVEVDSDRHHSTLLDREADRRRDARFAALGLEVVRIVEREIDARDQRALERLAAARARAAARRAA